MLYTAKRANGETDVEERVASAWCGDEKPRDVKVLAPAGVRAAVSPTWQLPVLERVIRLCTLGSGVTLTTWHHIAGKREAET